MSIQSLDATITIKDTHLKIHYELLGYGRIRRRDQRFIRFQTTRNMKNQKSSPSVEQEVKSNRLSSIDETINYLKLHQPDRIKNMVTVSTKTLQLCPSGKNIHQAYWSSTHGQKKDKEELEVIHSKKTERYFHYRKAPVEYIKDREEFGHWEGDLVTGPRDGQNGAYLTLIERKTRFYYMIPISAKSSKQVYMQINKLHKFYGDSF